MRNADTRNRAKVASLLSKDGITLDATAWALVQRHLGLIHEWNTCASLVSAGDLAHLVERHVADALSLAPVIVRACGKSSSLMDVGSGGGFPAIPLKIALPELELTLVERSSRRVGFLRKVVRALGLSRTTILHGEFPGCAAGFRPGVLTARAVENPQRFLKQMQRFMGEAMVFVCQSGDPRGVLGDSFHVEHVSDAWTDAGLRRGNLFVVRRTGTGA